MNSSVNPSSFVIQPYRRKYLAEYCKRMSKDNLGTLWDDNVASVLEEQGFNIEEDPRSVYKVEKLYESLAKYEPSKSPKVNLNDSAIQAGICLAYACFANPDSDQKLELEAFTPQLVYKITSNKKGSAGLTAWGQTKAESYVRAYERGLQQIRHEKRPDPCVAFKRTQFNDKTRLVWGYPYAMTALEGLFARPLIERFKGGCTPMAFAMPTGVLGAKLRVSGRHKTYAYSTDVSSFDSSIPAALIRSAFQILETWFDLDQIEPTSGHPYRDIWNQIVHYFIHTPIFMPDGNVYKGKRHGVPSGSYFTQMVDSIVNVICCGAISHHFNFHVDKEDILVLGDDLLFWSNRLVSLEDVSDYATSLLGMKFNAAKSSVNRFDEPIHYLGRDWTCGVPTLDEAEILKRMSQPETFRKYPKEVERLQRQVRMTLLSYAAVYRNAYPIYLQCVDGNRRFHRTNMDIEKFVYQLAGERANDAEFNSDHLSGLQRFLRKYGSEDSSKPGGFKPLAMQHWE